MDFLLLDYLVHSAEPDLRTSIKERGITSLAEAVDLTNQWLAAHPPSKNKSSGFQLGPIVNCKL